MVAQDRAVVATNGLSSGQQPITGVVVQRARDLPSASPLVRHAICHHVYLGKPVGPWPTLCGRATEAALGDHLIPKCPDCVAAARSHGMVCDCFKRGRPGATIPLR